MWIKNRKRSEKSEVLDPVYSGKKKPGRAWAWAHFHCKRSKCQKGYQKRPRIWPTSGGRLGPAFSHCKRKPGPNGVPNCDPGSYASFGQQTMEAIMTSTMSHCWVRTFCAWVRKRTGAQAHLIAYPRTVFLARIFFARCRKYANLASPKFTCVVHYQIPKVPRYIV